MLKHHVKERKILIFFIKIFLMLNFIYFFFKRNINKLNDKVGHTLLLKEQFKYLKNYIFNKNNFLIKHYIMTISVISYFLLIVYTPIFSVIWLCLPSLYFLYKHNYKDFFLIWG